MESIGSFVSGLQKKTNTHVKAYALAVKQQQSNVARPVTKTVTRTVAVPKTKIVKQPTPQQTAPKGTERADFAPIRPQPPLPNQQDDRDKR